MAKTSVSWTPPANADLRGINEWLAHKISPEFAIKALAAIRIRCELLVDFSRDARLLRGGTRILRVLGTPYLIRDRIVEDIVPFLRVHHEREDWQLET